MLVNRGVLRAGDYPGTCGVRRTALRRAGPWDGDVLFDNEEMLRHLALSGARVAHAVDFFVRKRPTTLAKWREQRPRQAYEDFGMRTKTWLFAALIPALLVVGALAGARLALGVAAGIALVAVALALRGRRDGAARFVPAHVALWAPLWAAERAVSTWWALYWRLRHGGYPFGDRRLTRGTGRAWEAGGRVPVARDRAA